MTSAKEGKRPKPSLEPKTARFEQILLYETSSFFYLIGSDFHEIKFRMLKLDRRIVKPNSLQDILIVDPLIYTKEDMFDMLNMINEGNKSSGGLTKVATACGIVGFVKFLDCYYLTLVTQKRKVGTIGGNDVHAIKSSEIFPIKPREVTDTNTMAKLWRKLNQKLNQTSAEIAESRYMGLFQFVDITKDFYFSYEYDITNSLQYNYLNRQCKSIRTKSSRNARVDYSSTYQEMFVWNQYQIEEFSNILGHESANNWILPIIHGFFQQRRFSIIGRVVDITIIARRSRYYAGTRYLKRGVNVHGKVANDVEIEQIIQVDSGGLTKFSSLIQMRGSIPTYWSQETSVTQPKPPIVVNRFDPTYLATQEHFADLIRRYNLPIVALDLVKHEERRAREVIVGKEYRQALEIINSSMPLANQIRYIALDYSKLSKSGKQGHITKAPINVSSGLFNPFQDDRNVDPNNNPAATGTVVGREWALLVKLQKSQRSDHLDGPSHLINQPHNFQRIDLFSELEHIAIYTLFETGFFISTTNHLDRLPFFESEQIKALRRNGVLIQKGALRTNCIDCLDRTNGAQFALGLQHVSFGLQALGLLDNSSISPTSILFLELMEMYGDMGDRIAVQYGGSEAHNKMAGTSTSANRNASSGQMLTSSNSSSKQGELLTSIKRYYSNAFTDMVKQDAMNVFLGCFVPQQQQIPLWDFDSDYELHNRSLHPPEPYMNKVLFHDMPQAIEELNINQYSIDSKNPLIEEKSNDQQTLSRFFVKSLHSDEDLLKSSQSSNDLIVMSPSTKKHQEDYFREYIRHSITRSERRKMISKLTKEIVREAVEHWWKEAQRLHEMKLTKYNEQNESNPMTSTIESNKTESNQIENDQIVNRTNRVKSFKLVRTVVSQSPDDHIDEDDDQQYGYYHQGDTDLYSAKDSCKDVRPYFDRVYEPQEITFFDDYLSYDCYTTIDVIPDPIYTPDEEDKIADASASQGGMISRAFGGGILSRGGPTRMLGFGFKKNDSNDSLLDDDDDSSRSSDPSIVGVNNPSATIHTSNKENFLYKKRDDGASINSDYYYGIINSFEYDSLANSYISNHSDHYDIFATSLQPQLQYHSLDNQNNSKQNSLPVKSIDDDENDLRSSNVGIVGGMGRYVREIGMKARYFVGGLLVRKDGDERLQSVDDYTYSKDIDHHSNNVPLDINNRQNWDAISNHQLYRGISNGSTSVPSSQNMNIFKPITQRTISQYASYASQSIDPTSLMTSGVFPDPLNDYSIGYRFDSDSFEPFEKLLNDSKSSVQTYPLKSNSSLNDKHTEYKEHLHEMTGISVDDVKGMEKLSYDSYITTTIHANNEYDGLSHMDSAVLVSELLFSSLNYVEEELIKTFHEVSDDSQSKQENHNQNNDSVVATTHASNDHPNPPIGNPTKSTGYGINIPSLPLITTRVARKQIQGFTQLGNTTNDIRNTTTESVIAAENLNEITGPKEQTTSNPSNVYEKALMLKQRTKDHIFNLCRELKVGIGLENSIFHHSYRYLFEQVLVLRDIDETRISRRMSSFTTARAMADYIGMFSREVAAMDYQCVDFITSDSSVSDSSDIENLKEILKSYYEQHNEYRRMFSLFDTVSSTNMLIDKRKHQQHKTSRNNLIASSALSGSLDSLQKKAQVTGDDQITDKSESEKIEHMIIDREYEGFILSSSDVYVRRTNPYLIMNEAAATRFSSLMKRLHHL